MSGEKKLLSLDNIKNDQLEEQIKVREQLIYEMVGWLYPAILRDELAILRKRLWESRHEPK